LSKKRDIKKLEIMTAGKENISIIKVGERERKETETEKVGTRDR